LGRAVSWLTTVLVVFICYDVLMRYQFNSTAAWITELEWHLFALIFLLGAGYTLRHDKHVRVDLFYASMDTRDKAWVNLVGTLVFLIPWCLVLLYFSFFYALDAYQLNESSPDPGGLPARYLIKFSICVGVFFLLLQAIALVLESIQQIRQTKTDA
ncbi:MAG: TRAP transporter small permease subunit, partial [Bacteroidota bacterium]